MENLQCLSVAPRPKAKLRPLPQSSRSILGLHSTMVLVGDSPSPLGFSCYPTASDGDGRVVGYKVRYTDPF